MPDDVSMFTPLGVEELAAANAAPPSKEKPVPIIPVPVDAPECDWKPWYGTIAGMWPYHDEAGCLVGYAARVNHIKNGQPEKEFFPITYCRLPDQEDPERSQCEWRPRGIPEPRPLYNLPSLIASPTAPVIVTEGEKKADVASKLFPDYLGTTSMGGARAAKLTDWMPLAGRNVIVWPDHDQPGSAFAEDVAALATQAGAASVLIVQIPANWPEKWDLADPVPGDEDSEILTVLLASARPWVRASATDPTDQPPPVYVSFGPFRMIANGLFCDTGDEKPVWLSGPFEVLALTRDNRGHAWGKLLRWTDPDGTSHEWAMPLRALGGDRADVWRELLDRGLEIAPSPGSRNRLAEYLSGVQVDGRARAVTRIGWHDEEGTSVFVLPDHTYPTEFNTRILWQTELRADTKYLESGSIKDWQDSIDRRCIGNSRLAFAVSAGFAPPLLAITREENAGFHFKGASRSGKTTILHTAGSVWGGGGLNGYLQSWRTTSNGLESTAVEHCDTLLCLDEMGQVDAGEAGEIAYMLANGFGKGRARRDGSARRALEWRLLFLSSGEISLADKMAEIGRRAKAGQEVRLVDIPVDAGVGLGAFEVLHDAASSGAFAEELRLAAGRYYGTPIRRFLDLLASRYAIDGPELHELLRAERDHFVGDHLPKNASGQVRSVCLRFALIAAAGNLATAFGLTGWPDDEADRAAAVCFRAWLNRRGNIGDHEIEAGIRQVVAYIEAHGSSRFEAAWDAGAERVINRSGFRRRDDNSPWQYMVMPEQWRNEVTKGFDASALARTMVQRGLMIPDGDGKPTKPVRVPGHGTMRLHILAPGILGDEEDNDAR